MSRRRRVDMSSSAPASSGNPGPGVDRVTRRARTASLCVFVRECASRKPHSHVSGRGEGGGDPRDGSSVRRNWSSATTASSTGWILARSRAVRRTVVTGTPPRRVTSAAGSARRVTRIPRTLPARHSGARVHSTSSSGPARSTPQSTPALRPLTTAPGSARRAAALVRRAWSMVSDAQAYSSGNRRRQAVLRSCALVRRPARTCSEPRNILPRRAGGLVGVRDIRALCRPSAAGDHVFHSR